MKTHLDAERTTYLVYGLLEEDEKLLADAHLSDCSSCADAVRRLEEERGDMIEATATAEPREEMVRSVAAQVYAKVSSLRRGRVRRAWLLGCAAGAFVAIGFVYLARTKDIAEKRASAVAMGRFSVQRGEYWVHLEEGYKPSPGDRIRTDDPAGAKIRLEEGSQFTIQRGSMVEFRGTRGPTPVLRLLEGEVRCEVVPDPRPFSVEAAGATATVVGTEFALHVLDDQPFFKHDEKMRRPPKIGMIVTEGAVLFKNTEGDVTVRAGWIALAGKNGAPWIWGQVKDLANDRTLDTMLRRTRVQKPAAEAAPAEMGWRDRTDSAVQARVDAVPWSQFAGALVRYYKHIDDSVMEQRTVVLEDTDVSIYMTLGYGTVRKLAEELHVNGPIMQACRNKLASVRFLEAVVEAVSGAPLSEEHLNRLQASAAIDNLLPAIDASASTLERWKTRTQKTAAFVRQLKEILTPDQYRRVTRSVGPSFFVDGYKVWLVEGSKVEGAADRIARIWAEQFQLPTYAQEAVAKIATQHVKAHVEAVDKFRRRTEAVQPGLDEIELTSRLLGLQAEAERNVSDIPSLNGQARTRTAAGSDILFMIRIGE
ncbi:MAG TPA: FecR family protein [Planctomycetota bacterium]|nr:FecR family protein [Planctomycetota bacterium]